jgi:hypothetical protein
MTFNIRRPLSATILALPLLFATNAAVAQSGAERVAAAAREAEARGADPVAAAADAVEAEDRRLVQSQGPTAAFGYAPNAPQFELSTNRGDGEATIMFAGELSRTGRDYDPATGDDRRTSSTSRVYLRGVAPLDKDDEDAPRFVNLANPLGGSRITIGFVHYISSYTLHRDQLEAARADRTTILRACLRQTVSQWQREALRTEEQIALTEAYYAEFADRLATAQGPELALLQTNGLAAYDTEIPAPVRNRCLVGNTGSPRDTLELAAIYGDPEQVVRIGRAVTGNAPTLFFGAEGTVSQNDYSFLDRTAFKIDEASHRGYAISAFAGVIGGSGSWSLRAGLTYARDYKQQRSIELCRPLTGSTDTQCLTGRDGPPTRQTNAAASLEGRLRFATPIGDIGLAPAVAIDLDEGEYTLDLPIYIARDSDDRLTGGVQVGYSSAKNDVSFGFFIGVPFNIFQ